MRYVKGLLVEKIVLLYFIRLNLSVYVSYVQKSNINYIKSVLKKYLILIC
jgi:hypothetical protein